jgi:hypothetical protein
MVTVHYYCYNGVRLCICGTAVANIPTVHPPDNTRVNMEHWWNYTDMGKQKDSEKILSQCYFVHHKHHMDCPRNEHWPPQ